MYGLFISLPTVKKIMSLFSDFVLTALLVSAVLGSPLLEKTKRKQVDPKLVRLQLTNDFETGHMDPWYDESPGDTHWVVENSTSSREPTPAPVPSSGQNYLRMDRPDGYTSGLGVLYTPVWTANPGDKLTLSFWIRSRHTQGNTLDIYWINGTREEKLLGLSSFSTASNFEWRTAEASIPVTAPTDTQLVIYGFCGPNEEDSIALDNIIVELGHSDSTTTTISATTTTDAPSIETTTARPVDCEYVITDSDYGTFTSPGYPGTYSNNLNCRWLISVPDVFQGVYLSFSHFDLETADRVRVYDGPSTSNRLLLDHTGTFLPPIVYSTSNTILVTMTTDYSVTWTGFFATYHGDWGSVTVDTTTTAAPVDTTTVAPVDTTTAAPVGTTTVNWLTTIDYVCGGYLNGWGVFYSPNYPIGYSSNLDCIWRIESDYDFVYLRMDYFLTELGYDKVIVYDGWEQSGEVLALWSGACSSDECFVTSRGKRMLVRFITNGSNNNYGFQAAFGSAY